MINDKALEIYLVSSRASHVKFRFSKDGYSDSFCFLLA